MAYLPAAPNVFINLEVKVAESNKPELASLTDKFFTAYNELDLETFGGLLADDVHWEHHNRFKGKGRDPLLESVRDIAKKLPDRKFSPVSRWAVNGNVVHVEHQWSATPIENDDAWGWIAGVPTSMDAASVLVYSDGKIVEWSDYA